MSKKSNNKKHAKNKKNKAKNMVDTVEVGGELSNVIPFRSRVPIPNTNSIETAKLKMGLFEGPGEAELSSQMISKNALVLLGVLVLSWVGNQILLDLSGSNDSQNIARSLGDRGLASVKSISAQNQAWQNQIIESLSQGSKRSLTYMGRKPSVEEKLKFETLSGNYKFTYSVKGGISQIVYMDIRPMANALDGEEVSEKVTALTAEPDIAVDTGRLPFYVDKPLVFLEQNRELLSADFGRADLISETKVTGENKRVYNLFTQNQVTAQAEMIFDSFNRLLSLKIIDASKIR